MALLMNFLGRTFWKGSLISTLESDQVFVFGSNPEGRHGRGSAFYAKQHFGAENGKGRGFTGKCYALPTTSLSLNFKDRDFPNIIYDYVGGIKKEQVIKEIEMLYQVAISNPNKKFLIGYTYDYLSEKNKNIFETKKGLSGYNSYEILEMFISVAEKQGELPSNIIFSESHIVPMKEIYPKFLSLK